jgi:hypothetical protein
MRLATLFAVASLGLLGLSACKKEASTPGSESEEPTESVTSTVPDEGPLPQRRTGTREPVQLDPLTGAITARFLDGAEYFELHLDTPAGDLRDIEHVHIDDMPHALAFAELREPKVNVIVRRPSALLETQPEQIRGTIWFSGRGDERTKVFAAPFVATASGTTKEAELPLRFTEAFVVAMRGSTGWRQQPSHPWRAFAAGRIHAAMLGLEPGRATATGFDGPRRASTDLSRLMHTTTAATSLQEALQHDRGLRVRQDPEPATVPIAELDLPGLRDHPFAKMQAALPDPNAGVPEPAAQAVPAEFWYLRFDDIRMFLRVLDEADAWITPVAHLLEDRVEVRDLAGRYQQQLALSRTGLAKALGHTVVERLAIVGSDPYLREGSDVTFIFTVKNRSMFDAELERHLSVHRAQTSEITQRALEHHGRTITVHADPNGVVRQHRADVDALSIVSNSEAACRAVLDAIEGRRARLSDEPDLAYMLARDPGSHQAFAFLGDRFIAAVVGPRQKVLQARRQQALAELSVPAYAAILHGWLHGRPPNDTQELVASRLLGSDELEHADGSPISFSPGRAPSSRWGRPEALTALLDLETPTKVTASEREAYAEFVRGYQDYWRQFIDPVAVRLDVVQTDEGEQAVLDVRVLPLISGTDYAEIEEVVGQERITVPALGDGFQAVWAVGRDSKLRRELDQMGSMFGSKDVGLGWLGDWVVLGSLDRRALAEFMAYVDDKPHFLAATDPEQELAMARLAGKLPVYAMAHIRNPAAFVATLSALRVLVNQVAPGTVSWGEHSQHADLPIVRIGINPKSSTDVAAFADAIAVYYVQVGDTVVFALVPEVLHAIIDRFERGEFPKRGVATDVQFVIEGRLAPGRAAWTTMLWALQDQANGTQGAARTAAEVILRADPSIGADAERLRALSVAYFGSHPASPAGQYDFTLGREGVRDPIFGSAVRPTDPELPIAGSPIATLMARLSRVRGEVAFDREPAQLEPPARSLHTRFHLTLAPADE